MDLSKVIAVVTGGASGLGEATVRRIVEKGGRAAILDRENSKGAELAAELGDGVRFFVADVTSREAVEKAVDGTVAALGGVNVAVNCAGVGTIGRVVDKTGNPHRLDHFEMTIRVNLIGTFNVLAVAASRMAKNEPFATGERGVIVNTASAAAFDGQIGQVAYSASKGGVVGMTLPVARDLASLGIRCLTIAPGTFDTPMLASASQQVRDSLAAAIPFPKRMGDPAEFGLLVTQILENPYLNGEVIRLDGSIRMAPR